MFCTVHKGKEHSVLFLMVEVKTADSETSNTIHLPLVISGDKQ